MLCCHQQPMQLIRKRVLLHQSLNYVGIVTSSNARQVTLDSRIKVPKVTEEFSQDTFVQLNIKGMDIFMCVVRTIYHKILAAIETDGFGNSRPIHQVLY